MESERLWAMSVAFQGDMTVSWMLVLVMEVVACVGVLACVLETES